MKTVNAVRLSSLIIFHPVLLETTKGISILFPAAISI